MTDTSGLVEIQLQNDNLKRCISKDWNSKIPITLDEQVAADTGVKSFV